MGLRLDPELIDEVRVRTDNLAAAIEEGLRLWLKQDERLRSAARRVAAKDQEAPE